MTATPTSPAPEAITESAFSMEADAEPHYLGPRALVALMSSLFLVVIMYTLDSSIIATAIPKITDQFHTIADIGWYAAAYQLTSASLQPLTGKAYTYFSLKYTFLFFVALFEVGSLICALAQSSTMFVVGRAIAGMGASGLLNGALTILAVAAPPSQRPMLMGLIMSMAGIGQLAGPLIGGALTEHASWRWCFWINLPIGGVTLAIMLFVTFPPYRARKAKWTFRDVMHDFDITGFAIFAPSCVMLLLALEWGGTTYSWSSATIIGLFCGSGAAFAVFFVLEYFHGEAAMIPMSLLRIRVVYSSMVTTGLQFGGMLIFSYYLPLWFQTIKSASPTMSGVYMLPTFGTQVFGAILAGTGVSRLGYPMPFSVVGSALTAISGGLMSTFTVHTGTGKWVGYQILHGLGRGISFQQPIQAVQAVVKPDMVATATAAAAWAQTFGAAILIGLAQTTFINLLRPALKKYAPGVDADKIVAAGATDISAALSASDDAQTLAGVLKAYNQAITQTFYLATGCAAASVGTSLGMGMTRLERKQKDQNKDEEQGKHEHNGESVGTTQTDSASVDETEAEAAMENSGPRPVSMAEDRHD
ncbi:hypothetical protein A1O1_03367 [Capronia coronata CBS 617.96]|uniref:Major facilitator superfamily (MFS) profile domain-containing protein n=1 Tax=Capronia coronata CBS 617.96 TaxID=1182541 RepID=W9YCL8_9EURO|nr:uncharacterized protein A1O1_03367 [Capronia coronata CBS 617.96]EXJ90268.1 hypothetical protein A1O1_03367 [Capronia coronata CBS 617.96]